jgi:4-hydroxybenzoate polyprenyltransferase
MNNVILKTAGFFKLYRPDVPVIVFLGTFAGRVFTTGFRASIIYEALFLALFPYNFVYTLNSITDITEDSINKPLRPIPSGLITKNEALIWLLFLTIVSVTGISFIFKGVEMFLAFLIILLGFSYSMPPLVIKKRALLAPVITGWGVTHPLFITGGMTLFLFSLSVMLHAIGTTSLKDLTDIEGDTAAGRKTISATKGIPSVIVMSLFFKIFSIILFQFTQYRVASIIPVISIFVVLFHYFYLKKDFAKVIYKRTIWTTATLSVFVILYIKLT